LWLVERVARRWYPVVVFSVGTVVLSSQLLPQPRPLSEWGWLFVAGFTTWLMALPLALRLPDKLTEALTRLANRRVLVGGRNLAAFLAMLHRQGRGSALAGAVMAVGAIVLSFVFAYYHSTASFWTLLAMEAVAAVPVGLFGGRAVSYGLSRDAAGAGGFVLRPDPDHLDSAAGLRPVGALFFYSALLLAIPGAFPACWWVLIPLYPEYSIWRESYAVMLLIVVVAQVLAFVLLAASCVRLMCCTAPAPTQLAPGPPRHTAHRTRRPSHQPRHHGPGLPLHRPPRPPPLPQPRPIPARPMAHHQHHLQ
jgi:hypothetical protein